MRLPDGTERPDTSRARPEPPSSGAAGPEDVVETTSATVGAPNPLAIVGPSEVARGLRDLVAALSLRPDIVVGEAAQLARAALHVVAGHGPADIASDRRFRHPAWQAHAPYRLAAQLYLAGRDSLQHAVDRSLDGPARQRAAFAARLVTETLSPTNSLLSPEVLAGVRQTRGTSLARGARNALDDLRNNGAMPSLAPRGRLQVGVDLAATHGAVVHREPMYELLQYTPTTRQVRAVPLLMVPSQVNKYYLLDLAPGRSLVEYALRHGIQFFAISWRNPSPSRRAWDLSAYVTAVESAGRIAARIAGSEAANLLAVCAGGVAAAALLGRQTPRDVPAPPSATFLVSEIDTTWASDAAALADLGAARRALRRSQRRGVMPGRKINQGFAMLRPKELIFDLAVNNWLLGNEPPGSEILTWNADHTNLPAGLYADLLRIQRTAGFGRPGGVTVDGEPVDLGHYGGATYTVGALADHIVAWQSTYRSARLFGHSPRFVATTGGHVQSLVNPPGHPRSGYLTHPGMLPDDPDDWLATATRHTGTWWDDWLPWLTERSGGKRPAPSELGSAEHPVLMPAPGRYVLEPAS